MKTPTQMSKCFIKAKRGSPVIVLKMSFRLPEAEVGFNGRIPALVTGYKGAVCIGVPVLNETA